MVIVTPLLKKKKPTHHELPCSLLEQNRTTCTKPLINTYFIFTKRESCAQSLVLVRIINWFFHLFILEINQYQIHDLDV